MKDPQPQSFLHQHTLRGGGGEWTRNRRRPLTTQPDASFPSGGVGSAGLCARRFGRRIPARASHTRQARRKEFFGRLGLGQQQSVQARNTSATDVNLGAGKARGSAGPSVCNGTERV